MQRKDATKIYTTSGGQEKLLAVKAIVDGILSLAYIDANGGLISYAPWSDVKGAVEKGPYRRYTTH